MKGKRKEGRDLTYDYICVVEDAKVLSNSEFYLKLKENFRQRIENHPIRSDN